MAAFTTGGGNTVPLPDDFPPVKTTQPDKDSGSSLGDIFTEELLANWQWGVNPDIFNEPYSEERCQQIRQMGAASSASSMPVEDATKLVMAVLDYQKRPYNPDVVAKYMQCSQQGYDDEHSSSGLWIGLGIAAVAVGIFALTLRKK